MGEKILSYRDLEVWKNGVKLAKDIIISSAGVCIHLYHNEQKTQVNTCARKKI